MTETAIAKKKLQELEGVIERGLATFLEVGSALAKIRDEKLYKEREGYSTFQQYCKERWGWDERHANRLIAAETVAKRLGPNGPTSEGQTRPLTKLAPTKQGKAWSRAVELAEAEGAETPTGRHVSKAVREIDNPVAGHIGPKKQKKIVAYKRAAKHLRLAIRELKDARKLLPDGNDESRVHGTIKILTTVARSLEAR